MFRKNQSRFFVAAATLVSAGGAMALTLLLSTVSPTRSQADEAISTFEERRHARANALRERARDQAQSQLGFGLVHPGIANRYIDFLALSAQVARLGAMVEALLSQMTVTLPGFGNNPILPPEPTVGTPAGAPSQSVLSAIYGPEGPTVKSVRALLEYRLVVIGNPRISVGNVEADEDRVVADIVTKDGSLVERYSIDKQTGFWKPES